MTIDDIIAAFRSVQTGVAKAMQHEHPHYSPEGAQIRIDFIEDFLTRVKRGGDASGYLSRWGESNPDTWDDIMDEVLVQLGVNDTDEFWPVLSKGL